MNPVVRNFQNKLAVERVVRVRTNTYVVIEVNPKRLCKSNGCVSFPIVGKRCGNLPKVAINYANECGFPTGGKFFVGILNYLINKRTGNRIKLTMNMVILSVVQARINLHGNNTILFYHLNHVEKRTSRSEIIGAVEPDKAISLFNVSISHYKHGRKVNFGFTHAK